MLYERPGGHYGTHRRADPRWAAQIAAALGDARTAINVGAGAGSYEPRDRRVVAVEPAQAMIAQRPQDAAPVVRAVAEALPFPDGAFDVALAVLTVHHWTDAAAGFAELRRVARRQVVVTWDPVVVQSYWLVRDYLPGLTAHDAGLVTLDAVARHLQPSTVAPLPVPADCTDGFLAAYWARPDAYLDPAVRAAISGLTLMDQRVVAAAMQRLADDLASGVWESAHPGLRTRDTLDAGYRLVVAEA